MKFKAETFINLITESYANLNSVTSQVGNVSPINQNIINILQGFSSTAIVPTALILAAIFLYLDYAKTLDKINSSSMSSGVNEVKILALTLFKVCISVFLLSNLFMFCNAILEISDRFMQSALNANLGGSTNFSGGDVNEWFNGNKVDLGLLSAMGGWFLLQLSGIASIVAKIAVSIVMYGRTISIYTMMALAPIPCVFLFNEEYRHIGVSFLKSFGAVAIQGTVLIVCLKVFVIVATVLPPPETSINGWAMNIFTLSAIEITTILGSGKLSKMILSAM